MIVANMPKEIQHPQDILIRYAKLVGGLPSDLREKYVKPLGHGNFEVIIPKDPAAALAKLEEELSPKAIRRDKESTDAGEEKEAGAKSTATTSKSPSQELATSVRKS